MPQMPHAGSAIEYCPGDKTAKAQVIFVIRSSSSPKDEGTCNSVMA